MKRTPNPLSRLLLGGLCMIVLSACAQTIQPWVQPDISQKMKRLQIENYLLKHDLATYRKKLMQANIGKRKLAKKLQLMRDARPGQMQSTIRTPSRPQPQSALHKPAQTPPAAAKQKSRLTKNTDTPVQRDTTQKQAQQAPAQQTVVPKSAVSAAHQTAAVLSSKPTSAPRLIGKQKTGKQDTEKQAANKQITSKKTAQTVAATNNSQAINPQDWKLKKRLFFGSGHKGTSPAMRRQINAFAKTLSPEAKIHIAGHSDGEPVGGFAGKTHQSTHELADNKAVSLERGMAVVRALIAAGIDSERIQVAGFGATKPLASNDTVEGRAKNRRVEIFIAEPKTTTKSSPAPSVNPVQQQPASVSIQPAPAKVVAVKTIASEIITKTPAKLAPTGEAKVKIAPAKTMPANTEPVKAAPAKTTPSKATPAQLDTMKMRLFFDMGQKWTSPEMRRQLRTFANSLPPTARIRIVGHADGLPVHQPTASLADNQAISLERAKSVFRGLKAYGISTERMQVEAFGATHPLADNDTPEGRAKNRRVEVFINR